MGNTFGSNSTDEGEDAAGHQPVIAPVDDEGFVKAFDVDQVKDIHAFFDKFGFVCVRDVLNDTEIDATCAAFFDRFDKDDDSAVEDFFSRQRFGHLGVMGMMSDMSVPVLQNRQNPRVYEAFVAITGRRALIVDHDRFGALRPTLRPSGEKPQWRTVEKWLHLDSNPISGLVAVGSFGNVGEAHDWQKCGLVQGFLALTDARDADGGFHCVPGSHKFSRKWAQDTKQSRGLSTLQVGKDDPVREHIQKINVRKGCLLVWNGLLFHANRPNYSSNWRLVQYVRMYPADLTPFTPLFTEVDMYPSELEITPLGRRLFGIDAWPTSK